jgi:hypothetical protein
MQTDTTAIVALDTPYTKLVVGAVLFLFGAIVSHIWTRWRQRLVTLSWTSDAARIGVAGENPEFGKVEVLYNGNAVKNLQFATITVRNESNSDLEELLLVLSSTDGTQILYSTGQLTGSSHYLVINQTFIDTWTARTKAKAPTDQLSYFWTHRDYDIPVLNRGGHLTFWLFVTREDFGDPVFDVSCDHPGVQVRNRPPVPEFFGVPLQHAQIAGLVATLLVSVILFVSAAPTWLIGLGSWVLGVFTLFVGASLIRLMRGAVRLLS